MAKKDQIKAIEEAARAHSNLNTFASIVTILEGGHLYGWQTQAAEGKIIKICCAEQQKWLARYDRAVVKASRNEEESNGG